MSGHYQHPQLRKYSRCSVWKNVPVECTLVARRDLTCLWAATQWSPTVTLLISGSSLQCCSHYYIWQRDTGHVTLQHRLVASLILNTYLEQTENSVMKCCNFLARNVSRTWSSADRCLKGGSNNTASTRQVEGIKETSYQISPIEIMRHALIKGSNSTMTSAALYLTIRQNLCLLNSNSQMNMLLINVAYVP